MAGCKSGKSNGQSEVIVDSVWTKSKVLETIKKVNNYWQEENPEPAFAFGIRQLIIREILRLMR